MVNKVEPLKRFLIINPFGIGDVLFTTPVIKTIKDNEPDSIIGYWCNDRVKAVLENNTQINKIFALSRGDIKKIYGQSKMKGIGSFFNLLYTLKKEDFDISLDFSLEHRYSLIAMLAGIKRRIGFDYKKRGIFLTEKISIDGYQDKHVVEYYLDLLKFINIKPQNTRLQLSISEKDRKSAEDLLLGIGISNGDLIIGIAPGAGASWGQDALLKHWPAVKFAQLADRLINALSAKILFLGDESDRHIADIIVATMNNKPIDLVGKTALGELTAIINNLRILITNDGGPLHIAVALNKKTLSFFGPVDPRVYGPYPADENRHIVLNKASNCSPCYRRFRLSPCRNEKECLEGIEVGEAVRAINRLLN